MADKKEKGKKRVEEKGTEGVCREERRSGQGRRKWDGETRKNGLTKRRKGRKGWKRMGQRE